MTRKTTSISQEMKNSSFTVDTVTYNVLIHGYCKSSHINKALQTFSQMMAEGEPPTILT